MLPLFSCLLVSLLSSFCQPSFVLQMSSLAHQVVAKHAEHLSFASHLPVATSESSRLTPLQLVGNNPNQSFKENCKLYWCSTLSGLHPDFLDHRQNEQTSSKEIQRVSKARETQTAILSSSICTKCTVCLSRALSRQSHVNQLQCCQKGRRLQPRRPLTWWLCLS